MNPKLFVIPSNTNYVIETFKTPPLLHDDNASIKVLTELLTWKYLIPLIREKSGAYGAGCRMSNEGRASFYSYRDPQSLSTFSHYETAIQAIVQNRFDAYDLDSAKLTLFSSLDSTVRNKDKLVNFFISGVSEDQIEVYRNQCLNVTSEDIQKVCQDYFLDPLSNDQSSRVIFGSPSNNLEGFLARGWKIENFVEDLSLKQQDY